MNLGKIQAHKIYGRESSHYDKAAADLVVMFIEQLSHTKGDFYNKPFHLNALAGTDHPRPVRRV
jgi:hypothetical protein